jgi:hypothetical protein
MVFYVRVRAAWSQRRRALGQLARHRVERLCQQVQFVAARELAHRTVVAFGDGLCAFGQLQQRRGHRTREQHAAGNRGENGKQQRQRQRQTVNRSGRCASDSS